MTDKEILSNVIDKAIANGYKFDMLSQYIQRAFRNSLEVQLLDKYLIIFTHDFAKAFWGEKPEYGISYDSLDEKRITDFNDGGKYHIKYWQWHLMQMILEESPIKYLEKFL